MFCLVCLIGALCVVCFPRVLCQLGLCVLMYIFLFVFVCVSFYCWGFCFSLVSLVCVCMCLNEFVIRCFVMEFLFLFYFGIMYEYVSRFALVYMFICCGFFCCSVFRLGLGGFSCVLLWCYRLRWGGSLSFKYNQPVHGL